VGAGNLRACLMRSRKVVAVVAPELQFRRSPYVD
jgi:hypothetical protein